MGREELWKLLEELNDRLADQGVRTELYVVGGSAMALGYDNTRATMDVDCRIGESAHEVHEAAQTIAREHGLAEDWLNEAAAQTLMIPEEPDTAQRTVFAKPNLIVTIASPERMIAMKTAAGRNIDLKDIAELLPQSRIKSGAEAKKLAEHYFPHRNVDSDVIAGIDEAIQARKMPTFKKGHVNPIPPKAPVPPDSAHGTKGRGRTGPDR